jgi:hypothetical protein
MSIVWMVRFVGVHLLDGCAKQLLAITRAAENVRKLRDQHRRSLTARARPRPVLQAAALRGARKSRGFPLGLTDAGGRERTRQFRQRLTFELARTFACDPKLAAGRRQRVLFAIETEAKFDQALFALRQRPQSSIDGASPGK